MVNIGARVPVGSLGQPCEVDSFVLCSFNQLKGPIMLMFRFITLTVVLICILCLCCDMFTCFNVKKGLYFSHTVLQV